MIRVDLQRLQIAPRRAVAGAEAPPLFGQCPGAGQQILDGLAGIQLLLERRLELLQRPVVRRHAQSVTDQRQGPGVVAPLAPALRQLSVTLGYLLQTLPRRRVVLVERQYRAKSGHCIVVGGFQQSVRLQVRPPLGQQQLYFPGLFQALL